MKLCIFTGLNVGGAVGWWLGEPVGIWTAFGLSAIGTLAGVYAGWWTARRLFE